MARLELRCNDSVSSIRLQLIHVAPRCSCRLLGSADVSSALEELHAFEMRNSSNATDTVQYLRGDSRCARSLARLERADSTLRRDLSAACCRFRDPACLRAISRQRLQGNGPRDLSCRISSLGMQGT